MSPWDRTAWRMMRSFGNPLRGFSVREWVRLGAGGLNTKHLIRSDTDGMLVCEQEKKTDVNRTIPFLTRYRRVSCCGVCPGVQQRMKRTGKAIVAQGNSVLDEGKKYLPTPKRRSTAAAHGCSTWLGCTLAPRRKGLRPAQANGQRSRREV